MLPQRKYYDILDRAFDTGGLTDEMKADLQKLKGELDERDGLLRRYGETYDGEREEEWDFKPFDTVDYKSQYTELLGRYNGLSARYNDMMVNSHSTHETDIMIVNGEEDVKPTDYDTIRITDIITEKE